MEDKNEELNEEDIIPTEEECVGLSEIDMEVAIDMFTNSLLGLSKGYKGSDKK